MQLATGSWLGFIVAGACTMHRMALSRAATLCGHMVAVDDLRNCRLNCARTKPYCLGRCVWNDLLLSKWCTACGRDYCRGRCIWRRRLLGSCSDPYFIRDDQRNHGLGRLSMRPSPPSVASGVRPLLLFGGTLSMARFLGYISTP